MDVEVAYVAGWVVAVGLMVVGLLGTVLPMLPGTILILAGIVLGAWLDDFSRVSYWTLGVVLLLAILTWLTDYLSTVMGAQRAGASRLAVIGALVGTVVGIFMGLIGVFVMPFVGAVAGELITRRNARQATKVGVATWVGLIVGTVVKLALSFMMIGLFVIALII